MRNDVSTVLRPHAEWLARADAIVVPADIELAYRELPWRYRPYLASVADVTLLGGEWLLYSEAAGLLMDTMHQTLAANPARSPWVAEARGDQVVLRMPAEPIRVTEPCVLLGSRPWHYHWLVDFLPRLLTIGQHPELADMSLVVGTDISPAQIEALERLGIAHERLLRMPPDATWRFDTLWAPSLWSDEYHLHPAALVWLRRALLGRASLSHDDSRLFVSRRDAELRHVVNEAEIEALLERHGFRTVLAGKLSFAEQLDIFSRARLVVGGTGSGLSNIVFAPIDSTYVELHNFAEGSEFIRFLATQMGQRYLRVTGETAVDESKLPHNWNYCIAPARLEEALAPLL